MEVGVHELSAHCDPLRGTLLIRLRNWIVSIKYADGDWNKKSKIFVAMLIHDNKLSS